ncbi:MAG: hypothetical protein JWR69_4722 [Pedosphaera sp.]|nr:hypothetical protein [Pedosphaera sp.]
MLRVTVTKGLKRQPRFYSGETLARYGTKDPLGVRRPKVLGKRVTRGKVRFGLTFALMKRGLLVQTFGEPGENRRASPAGNHGDPGLASRPLGNGRAHPRGAPAVPARPKGTTQCKYFVLTHFCSTNEDRFPVAYELLEDVVAWMALACGDPARMGANISRLRSPAANKVAGAGSGTAWIMNSRLYGGRASGG